MAVIAGYCQGLGQQVRLGFFAAAMMLAGPVGAQVTPADTALHTTLIECLQHIGQEPAAPGAKKPMRSVPTCNTFQPACQAYAVGWPECDAAAKAWRDSGAGARWEADRVAKRAAAEAKNEAEAHQRMAPK